MHIYRKFFGQKLKSALDAKGLKGVRLAEKIGINASNVSRWINGHDFPEDDRLSDICDVLGVPETYFVEMNPAPTSRTNAALIEINEELERENETLRKRLGYAEKISEDILKGIVEAPPAIMNNLRTVLDLKKSDEQKKRKA